MKRFYSIFIFVLFATTILGQLKKGVENIYFYNKGEGDVVCACYFSGNKVYYESWAWQTFVNRNYSYFKTSLMSHDSYVKTGYLQENMTDNNKYVYKWYGTYGEAFYLTFSRDMKTLVDSRKTFGTLKRIDKCNDTQNDDVIYE